MKNFLKILFSFLVWLVTASYAATEGMKYGVSPMLVVGVLLVVTVLLALYGSKGISQDGSAIFKSETTSQITWAKYIIKRLFKNNAFLGRVVRADQYVVHNTAVVIPNPGAAPTVIKNPNSFPLTAVQRADNVVMYALNSYITVPTFVTMDELDAIGYDKMESIYDDHFKTVAQQCADDQLINWANGLPGASNVVYTTGAATASLEDGQTGQRNTCVPADVKKLQRLMNKNNVDEMDRVIIMEANMFDQFTDGLTITQTRDFSSQYDPKTGSVGKLYGFDFMTRSSVLAAAAGLDGSGNLALNALGAALGATDNIGCLAFQKNAIELAMGSVHMFSRTNDPLYTGDINNVRIKAGGRVRRADNQGVYALMQGTAQ